MPPRAATLRHRALIAVISALLITVGAVFAPGLAAAEGELATAKERLEAMTQRFEQVVEENADARVELDRILSDIERTELQVRAIARSMGETEAVAVSLAQELYKGGGLDALEGVLSSQSLSEMDVHLSYLEYTGAEQTRIFEALGVRRDSLDRKLDELEDARSEAEAIVDHIETMRSDLDAEVAALSAEVERLGAELAEQQAAAQGAAASAQAAVAGPVTSSAPVPGPPYNADWDAMAMCESGGNWHLDSTYDGGLQFHPMTWLGHGGGVYAEYAWQASREQQIAIAENVLASQGPGAWPHCFQE